jgi:hypothetical protein
MTTRFSRSSRLTRIADQRFARATKDGSSVWEAILSAMDEAYELAVVDCADWVREAEGDGVAQDLLTDAGL